MSFSTALNEWISRLKCTGKELAAASGVSSSVISRYRTGRQSPAPDSGSLHRLAKGIAALADRQGISGLDRAAAEAALCAALAEEPEIDRRLFQRRFGELLGTLAISSNELARYMNYDASYLSRIRSGQRMPRDAAAFAHSVGRFIARRFRSEEELELLSELTGAALEASADSAAVIGAVVDYLCAGVPSADDGSIGGFLRSVDSFDLEEYIRVLRFGGLEPLTPADHPPAARFYTGLSGIMEAQLSFLRATALSREADRVTMYSDLPMSEMSQDPVFPKQWMLAMAAMLKNGSRLHMLHSLDRPFHEMMLGLESFVPLYMTGQITPYYLSGAQGCAFRHMLWVSGAAALQGECVAGHVADGRVYLTERREEVLQLQKMADQLLRRATPLMEIYSRDTRPAFERFLQADDQCVGTRRSILSSLPAYTLSDDLARRILVRNAVPSPEREAILAYIRSRRQRIEQILRHSRVTDTLPLIPAEEYGLHPMGLALAGMFCSGDILLTYDEYLEHLRLCEDFAREHPGYSCLRDRNVPFRNIQIQILEKERVIVTKNKSPAIHFVIRHPKMCDAIENMVVPITET